MKNKIIEKKERGFSYSRAKVLSAIKNNEPIAIHKLVELIKPPIPRSTILHHITQLEIRGIIQKRYALEVHNKKELGSPVYLVTNKSNPLTKIDLKISDFVIKTFKGN